MMAETVRAIEALEQVYRKIDNLHFCGFAEVDKEATLTVINEQIELEKKK